jgi:ketosteroid isomerase-like protein
MEDQMRKKLEKLVDRQEIYDCIQRYARGADRFDAEMLASAYHDDALDDHGPYVGLGRGMAEYWFPILGKQTISMERHLTSHSVELDGDTAHAETYVFVALREADGGKVSLAGGRYVDRLERRDGEWRISARNTLVEWRAIVDDDTSAVEGLFVGASRDRSDVSYMRPLEVTRPLTGPGPASNQ